VKSGIIIGQSAAQSGAFALLSSQTVSGVGEIDFTSVITPTYDDYQLELVGITVSTNTAVLGFQFSTNNGSTYDTGSNYFWAQSNVDIVTGSGGANSSNPDSIINLLAGGLSSSIAPALAGSYKIYAPLSTSALKYLQFLDVGVYGGNGHQYGVNGQGIWNNSSSAANAFRLIVSAGTVSGNARLYGLSH
jgi:hypothetical protein